MTLPQALTAHVLEQVRTKRKSKQHGSGFNSCTCTKNDGAKVKIKDFKYYECVPKTKANPHGLIFHKDGGSRLIVLAIGEPKNYGILTNAGMKISHQNPTLNGAPLLDHKKIKGFLANIYHCNLNTMLRNIQWKAGKQLLEQPAAFHLMAYLDGNNEAIGPCASEKYRSQKATLDKNLYNSFDKRLRKEVFPKIVEIKNELSSLGMAVADLQDEVETHGTDITAPKNDNKTNKEDVRVLQGDITNLKNDTVKEADFDERVKKVAEEVFQRRFAELKLSNVRPSKYGGVGFNNETYDVKEIPDKSNDKAFVQVSNCIRFTISYGDGGGSCDDDDALTEIKVTLGMLHQFCTSRVAIVPHDLTEEPEVQVVGTIDDVAFVRNNDLPGLVLSDWRLEGDAVWAKIIVDLDKVWNLEAEKVDGDRFFHGEGLSGPLPQDAYWEQSCVMAGQIMKLKLVDLISGPDLGHGSLVLLRDEKQKNKDEGMVALLLGPPLLLEDVDM